MLLPQEKCTRSEQGIKQADITVMAAAVADYMPEVTEQEKLKRGTMHFLISPSSKHRISFAHWVSGRRMASYW